MIKGVFHLESLTSCRKCQGIKKHHILPVLLRSKFDKLLDLSMPFVSQNQQIVRHCKMPLIKITLKSLALLSVLISYRLEQPSFPNYKNKTFPSDSCVINFIIFSFSFSFFHLWPPYRTNLKLLFQPLNEHFGRGNVLVLQ